MSQQLETAIALRDQYEDALQESDCEIVNCETALDILRDRPRVSAQERLAIGVGSAVALSGVALAGLLVSGGIALLPAILAAAFLTGAGGGLAGWGFTRSSQRATEIEESLVAVHKEKGELRKRRKKLERGLDESKRLVQQLIALPGGDVDRVALPAECANGAIDANSAKDAEDVQ